MPKPSRRSGTTEQQLSLLELVERVRREAAGSAPPAAPGSMDVDTHLREALSAALKASPLSRWQVAGRMSELLGADVTVSMLNTWTAPSKEGWRFPAAYVAAFCEATASIGPLEVLAGALGVHVLAGRERLLTERAALDQQIREARRRQKLIDAVLGEAPERAGREGA